MKLTTALGLKILLLLGLFGSVLPASANAAAIETTWVKVEIDNYPQTFEQTPFILEGVTLVPIRGIMEQLGAKVEWDGAQRLITVTKGTMEIRLRIGDKFAYVNQKAVELERSALIVQNTGTTMVPVRFFSEALGAKVGWQSKTKTVTIQTRETPVVTTVTRPPFELPPGAPWKTYRTKYFQMYFNHSEDLLVRLANQLDELYEWETARLGHAPEPPNGFDGRIPIFAFLNADYKEKFKNESSGKWIARSRSIFINLEDNRTFIDHTKSTVKMFKHELAHAITLGSTDSRNKQYPLWFIEGVSTYSETLEPYAAGTNEERVKEAYRDKSILSWSEMTVIKDQWPIEKIFLAYDEAESIWRYFVKTYGEMAIVKVFYMDGDFKGDLQQATGKSLEQLEIDWLANLAASR